MSFAAGYAVAGGAAAGYAVAGGAAAGDAAVGDAAVGNAVDCVADGASEVWASEPLLAALRSFLEPPYYFCYFCYWLYGS